MVCGRGPGVVQQRAKPSQRGAHRRRPDVEPLRRAGHAPLAHADDDHAAADLPAAKGDAGNDGQTGATGDTGPAGPLGPVGPLGSIGPEGPAGPKGDTGAPGKNGTFTFTAKRMAVSVRRGRTASLPFVVGNNTTDQAFGSG